MSDRATDRDMKAGHPFVTDEQRIALGYRPRTLRGWWCWCRSWSPLAFWWRAVVCWWHAWRAR
jgi:hypothetical protein